MSHDDLLADYRPTRGGGTNDHRDVLFADGLFFAFLRLRANLAAAFTAHWWFDAGLLLGFYALAHT